MDYEALWQTVKEPVLGFLSQWGMSAVGAVLIAILGWIIAGWAASRVRGFAEKSGRVDDTLAPILGKLTRLSVLAIVLVAVLDNLGIDTASVIAFLGAAGLAIGLALKDTVSDVAAGIAILILRPIRAGEGVAIGSVNGTVEEVGIFQTRLTSFDGIPIILNNARIRTSEIQNFSRSGKRRIDLTVGVGYGTDVEQAIRIMREVVDTEPRVLAEPEPLLDVTNLGESSVDVLVRVWVAPADFFPTKLALARLIKVRLDQDDIEIPFPQREVRLIGGSLPG